MVQKVGAGQRREIDAGHRQVDLLCATVARAEKEIAGWARKQLTQVTYDDKALMPDELARLLFRDREVHSLLPSPGRWTSCGQRSVGGSSIERSFIPETQVHPSFNARPLELSWRPDDDCAGTIERLRLRQSLLPEALRRALRTHS